MRAATSEGHGKRLRDGHGLTWRDEEGNSDFVRLLYGSIALLFFFRVLLARVC